MKVCSFAGRGTGVLGWRVSRDRLRFAVRFRVGSNDQARVWSNETSRIQRIFARQSAFTVARPGVNLVLRDFLGELTLSQPSVVASKRVGTACGPVAIYTKRCCQLGRCVSIFLSDLSTLLRHLFRTTDNHSSTSRETDPRVFFPVARSIGMKSSVCALC
ncbi:unnamed protein product [Protopolystoma xenopodis]|uniref:Uncharacterized protein n=1 Tax=Protopolystoma xenopodis TaxID=117903 RepID=A0A448WZZ3_9PLAT|nr:unnamed protein product [Protopolystoma xenopodis]